jgi:hypothetical protein
MRRRAFVAGLDLAVHSPDNTITPRAGERGKRRREGMPADVAGYGQALHSLGGRLKPATSTVPAATAKKKNDKKDDEYRGGVHLISPWPRNSIVVAEHALGNLD